jgi:hypothetical protein
VNVVANGSHICLGLQRINQLAIEELNHEGSQEMSWPDGFEAAKP